ncbi:hypothetical protein MtrunA17_Chr3g0096641 [Medicago truncatula]|uniref:Uncharacterized protein n=1 Tax=Medicago truncatula TaxID=3880 RepID=A0A396IMG3_MEDTR|nr:hypothetical protein MtrunA17_Chr3g0096641 [Medicago truncatula]
MVLTLPHILYIDHGNTSLKRTVFHCMDCYAPPRQNIHKKTLSQKELDSME